jgi:tetratricopeptide (TPR) repeat protein
VVGAANSPAPSGSSAEIHENTPPSDNVVKQKNALEYYKTGLELFEAGGPGAAVKAYLLSLALEPNSAAVNLSLGHAYLKLQKDNDAVKAFKESIRLNPDSPEAFYGLGLIYFRKHRNKDALDAFKRATILRPDMAKAHYGLALAYQELGREDGLIEEYRILERLDRSLAKQLSQSFPAANPPCNGGPFCN